MKKLLPNMVLRNTADNSCMRILCISPDYSDTVCIEIENDKALPFLDNVVNIETMVSNNELEIVENDPYYVVADENYTQDRYLHSRDEAYKYIQNICSTENLPYLYNARYRSKLITDAATEFSVTKKTVYKNLRKYLQGGMTKNALITLISPTIKKNNKVKTGRKREVSTGSGISLTENDLIHISNIYYDYYLKVDMCTLRRAYNEFLDRYYSFRTIENGKEVKKVLDDDKRPSFRQFTYHLNKIRDAKSEIIEKISQGKYNMVERPTLSREDINVTVPGQVYEIDATTGDIYLTSVISKNIIVGKPTVYIVIDVYSRLITGYYAGFENPSWTAAMMALLNMNEDKVEFCSKYGVEISSDEWPAYGVPAKINADNGELLSKASDSLVQHLGITVENEPPYRPDMKGIVERWFRTINDTLKRYMPGGVRKDHHQRGGHDYREDALLDINEFNKFMIGFIKKYNNSILKSFQLSKDMIDNNLNPTPSNIWNYGATMKYSLVRNVPRDKMMLALLPKAKASIHRGGIYFKGLYYSCDRAIRENWFLKSANVPKKIDIAYDPRNLDKIYIYSGKTLEFEVCHMLPKSLKDYKNISLMDLLKVRAKASSLKNSDNAENISLEINTHDMMIDIIKNAVKKKNMVDPVGENKLKNIRQNKENEKLMHREEEHFDLEPDSPPTHAYVVEINTSKGKAENQKSEPAEETYEEHMKKQREKKRAMLNNILSQNSNKGD